jgi:hypothetical protein
MPPPTDSTISNLANGGPSDSEIPDADNNGQQKSDIANLSDAPPTDSEIPDAEEDEAEDDEDEEPGLPPGRRGMAGVAGAGDGHTEANGSPLDGRGCE